MQYECLNTHWHMERISRDYVRDGWAYAGHERGYYVSDGHMISMRVQPHRLRRLI